MFLVKTALAGFLRWFWLDFQNHKKSYGKLMFLFVSRLYKVFLKQLRSISGFLVPKMVLRWRNSVRDCPKKALLGLDISKMLIFPWFF